MTAYVPADHFAVAQAAVARAPAAIGHNRPAPHVFDLHPMLHVAVIRATV